MMNRLRRFAKDYRLFVSVLAGAGLALGFDLAGFDAIAHWIIGLAAVVALVPLLKGMVEDLRMGKYGVDILAATAIITAVIMQEYWAAIIVVLMLTGGEALEDYAERRASRELNALLKRAPNQAHILRGGKVLDVPVGEVRTGDKIIIKPGEVVPVDAIILEGKASFDESSLTGESLPQIRKEDMTLLSGTVNLDGVITAKALRPSAESQYEQIIKLVRSAQKSQAPFVRLADHYAIPFTAAAFTIAIWAWAISGESIRFLEVLVVATPCPLILAAPIAIISGMSRAAKNGIIIKTGGALERLAKARTFAFDKTGTLTRGEPDIDTIKTFNGFSADEILGLAATLEQNSNHVLAQAIFSHARKLNKKLAKAKHVRELAGSGLQAQVGGKTILVGRLGLLDEYDTELPKSFKGESFQQTSAFVAVDGKLAGVITFKDDIRPESKQTLQALRQQGVHDFMMVTGDSQTVARAVASKLGIKHVVAEALPGDKIGAIESAGMQPVAFVGDGVNDAPVLTASGVGIALGARGSTAASESADIVIMQDDLSYVVTGRRIANRTFTIARQSILVGIALSVGLMLIYSTGRFSAVSGALIQELVDVIVIVNALRAHSTKNN